LHVNALPCVKPDAGLRCFSKAAAVCSNEPNAAFSAIDAKPQRNKRNPLMTANSGFANISHVIHFVWQLEQDAFFPGPLRREASAFRDSLLFSAGRAVTDEF
jgi:hypothetical protein